MATLTTKRANWLTARISELDSQITELQGMPSPYDCSLRVCEWMRDGFQAELRGSDNSTPTKQSKQRNAMQTTKTLTVDEINQRLRVIDQRQVTIEAAAMGESRGFTEAEAAEYDRLDGEARTLKAMKDRKYQVAHPRPLTGYNSTARRDPLSKQKWEHGFPVDQQKTRPASAQGGRSVAELFSLNAFDSGGFDSVGHLMQTIYDGLGDQRLSALSHGEFSDPLGGYLVPTQHISTILDGSLEQEVVRPRARVYPMISETLVIPRWDGRNRAQGVLFGGLSSSWHAETMEIPLSNAKLNKMTLNSHTLTIMVPATNRMLQDVPQFAGELEMRLFSTVQFDLDYAFLHGTGTGEPLGIYNSTSAITVPKETDQGAATLHYENLSKLYSRMYPEGRKRAVWLISSGLIPELLKISIPVGTAGSHVPLLNEQSGEMRIFGRPVIETEKAPLLGEEGDVTFVDLSQFAVGLRLDARIAISSDVRFTTDETMFKVILRADGRETWHEVMTPRNNGPTQSWCIKLGARE